MTPLLALSYHTQNCFLSQDDLLRLNLEKFPSHTRTHMLFYTKPTDVWSRGEAAPHPNEVASGSCQNIASFFGYLQRNGWCGKGIPIDRSH